ncbi:MAG: S1C family serine protease, partial [Eubacterium sp.]|nr:S1C family serine protease [Eubacterium sp.]
MLEYHDPMKPDENNGMNTGTQPQQQMRPQMPPDQRPVKKEKKDSFGKKLGRTVILALVFGLVAGIVFLGVGLGGAKLRNRNDVEKEYSDKDYEELREELENLKEEQQTSAKVETEEDEDDKDDTSDDSQDIDVQQVSSSAATTTLDYDVADIVEKTQPSIVSITTTGTTQYQYFFQTYEQPTSGAGSGIIIGQDDDALYVATNYHVIKDSDEIKVGFNDGEVVNAEVKGYDEDEDVAVVTVPKSDMKDSTKDAV